MSIDEYLEQNRDRHLEELFELLRIPSISTDPQYAGDVARGAEFVAERLREAGCTAKVHPTNRHPIVTGEWLGAPGAPTVLVYGHYDVQPPDPLELWRNPPFEPTIEDGNIVARGATDDKGQFYCHIKGVEAHLKTTGSLPVNVKFLIEGEEESGSESLEPFIEAHRDALAADIVVVSDNSMFAPGRPALTLGLRGMVYFELHVTGPSHDLHSGLYGGAVKNPINAICQLVSSMQGPGGRIAIEGFYDDVEELSDSQRAEMAAVNHDDVAWAEGIEVEGSVGEDGYSILERTTIRPTLDVNGLWGGYIEAGAKTVLPSQAHAKISCRLVPHQDPDDIEAKIRAHIDAHCPDGVSIEYVAHHGGIPFVVDESAPALDAAKAALERVWDTKPVMLRSGGSIPVVASFKQMLGLDTVMMGLGLPDDRLHSPNEKFALDCYFNGIRASAYVFEELGKS